MHHHAHIIGLAGFFLFGLFGSLHCLAMCGPLSSLFLGKSAKNPFVHLIPYHSARLISYAVTGFLIGSLGFAVNKLTVLPLGAIAVSLALIPYILGINLPAPRSLLKLKSLIFQKARPLSVTSRGVLTGLMTPLLPCGLLYGALIASLAAPSPYSGALWMASFAAGTIPLLFAGQMGFGAVTRRLKPRTYQLAQRGLAALALLTIIYMSTMHQH